MIKIKPSLEKDKLVRLLGGRSFRNISRSVELKIERLAVKLRELIRPSLHYRVKKVDSIKTGSIYLSDGITFKSPKLAKAMRGCTEIICFIGTLGKGIEKKITRLTEENRLSEAYILDSMGSVAVENMIEKYYQHMKSKYQSESKGVTLRFSPGYCDWPITEQKKLFNLFDSASIDVELMDSYLMMPRKSISGIFGVGHPQMDPSAASYNPCSECKKWDCIARRN